MRLSKSVVTSVVLTAIVCTSVSVAIAGSSGHTIHACASKQGGALRIAKKCRHSERAVTWSKTGPAGPQGPQGPGGASGVDGSARAYARVFGAAGGPSFQPSFDQGTTKGFTTVSEPITGHYCLAAPGLDPATTAPVATPILNPGSSLNAIEMEVVRPSDSGLCPSNQFHVVTERVQLDTSGPTPFAEAVPIGGVSFTIAVP